VVGEYIGQSNKESSSTANRRNPLKGKRLRVPGRNIHEPIRERGIKSAAKSPLGGPSKSLPAR